MNTARRPLADWRDLAVLVTVWGSSFALTRLAVAELHPAFLASARLWLGALVLYTVARGRGLVLPRDKRSWAWFVFLAMIGNVLPFTLIGTATQTISSALAGILISTVPLITLALAPVFLRDEPFTLAKLAPFAVGFAGVLILIGPDALFGAGASRTVLIAEGLIILAALGYALNGVTARLAPVHPPLTTATGVILAAALCSVPFALALGATMPEALSVKVGLAVLALGVGSTALAALVLYGLLPRAGASFVSLSNYLVPGFAVLVGFFFLDEQLGLREWIGLAVILSAVAVAGRHR